MPPGLAADPCTIRATARTVPANKLSVLLIFPLLSVGVLELPDVSGERTTREAYERGKHGDSPHRRLVLAAYASDRWRHAPDAVSRSQAELASALDRSVAPALQPMQQSPRVLDELLLAAFHDTEAHANNPLETDHGRLKERLRPMRGLKRDRTARVIVGGHAFVQNLRRGFYDLGTDVRPTARLADAFAELALVI